MKWVTFIAKLYIVDGLNIQDFVWTCNLHIYGS